MLNGKCYLESVLLVKINRKPDNVDEQLAASLCLRLLTEPVITFFLNFIV